MRMDLLLRAKQLLLLAKTNLSEFETLRRQCPQPPWGPPTHTHSKLQNFTLLSQYPHFNCQQPSIPGRRLASKKANPMM